MSDGCLIQPLKYENGYLVSETFATINSPKAPDTETVYGTAKYTYGN